MEKLILFKLFCMLSALQSANSDDNLQPTILNNEGCLLFETAENKNISIQLVGNANFIVNNVSLLDTLHQVKSRISYFVPGSDTPLRDQFENLRLQVFGPSGIESRIFSLENRTRDERMRRLILNVVISKLTRFEAQITDFEMKMRFDNCLVEPCKNGGMCVNLFDKFICHCKNNWQGETCEEDVNECNYLAGTDLGCQNGATCINTPGSYRCICADGWIGLNCLRKSADCLSSPPGELCGHGICVNAKDEAGYNCICDQGWTSNSSIGLPRESKACTVDVDECAASHSPCTSTCINTPGSFTCGPCPAGYTGNGFHCVDKNECLINNGGCSTSPRVLCVNTEGSYSCASCPVGWTGDGKICRRSETNACSSNICHPQALCQDISNRVVCVCPRGMSGDGFGLNGCKPASSNPCDPNPCKNGGTCTANGTLYSCKCRLSPDNIIQFSSSNDCEVQQNPCSSNPCLNGATCVSNSTDFSFTCICPRRLSGQFCTIDRRGCGRILRATSGSLKYPNMETYDRNERCAWVIQTTPTMVLNITFIRFDLEFSPNCIFDWLQIYDGGTSASQIIGRFCGTDMPKGGNIISTRNQMYLWFRSDNSSVHPGFELTWNSISPVCGGQISTETYGTIATPGYPSYSPPNRECEWTIRAPFGKKLHLVFYAVHLGFSSSCNDFISIHDGSSTSGELIEKFCNSTLPPPLHSSSHEITIYFSTDSSTSDSSFQLHYSVVEGIVGCGGLFTAKSGQFAAPRAVNRYVEKIVCEYFIQLPAATFIKLRFTEFKLHSNLACDVESLEVYEGVSKNLVWRQCGSSIPPEYTSTSNSLLVKFVSTQFISSSTFQAQYELGCGGVFRNKTGSIKSPLYPQNYLSDLNCLYTIKAPVGFAIKLVIITFHLEGDHASSWHEISHNLSCVYDYLEIFDGFPSEKHSIGRYCSTSIPVTILSKANYMYLVFNTDSNENYKGFNIVYTFVNVKCGGIVKEDNGVITSPQYSEEQSLISRSLCRWIIAAPDGYGVSFTFKRVDLNYTQNCTENFVQIISNSTFKDEEIGKYCGDFWPPYTMVLNNLITITYSTSQPGGFDLSYTFLDERNSCGGNYSMAAGTLHSPGWPSEYLSSRDCIWILSAPLGTQIELKVKTFTMESSDTCNFDFLEIRNGMTNSSPLIGTFCGQDIPRRIPSFTNHLYLYFHSDSTHNYAGFEIEWDRTSSTCGGLLDTYSGSILSPHYPELVTGTAQCQWHIVVNKGSTISMNIKKIGTSSEPCLENHLFIYDGIISSAANRLKVNCSAFEEGTIETTGNEALVKFTSIVDGIAGGFFLNYTINCNHDLHYRQGTIESPNFPNLYPNKISCQWNIVGSKGHTIAIDISHLNMEQFTTSNECRFDYLEIVDIKNKEIVKSEKYCDTKPEMITSLGEMVKINFHTDLYDKGSGFRLEYKALGCGETLEKPIGNFKSPNYPYSLQSNCLWILKTTIGRSMQITLDVVLESHDNCSSNSLTIATGPGGAYEVFKYCDTHSSHIITVPGHEVYIRFSSDALRTKKGFQINYRSVNSSCGGVIQAPSGTISSPNFPKNYSDNLYCEWLIDINSGLKITLQTLDIESSINCTNDYLEIYDTNGLEDSQLRRYCGSDLDENQKELRFLGSKVHIIMKTNNAIAKSGFSLSYVKQCLEVLDVSNQQDIIRKTVNQRRCVYILKKPINSNLKIVLTVMQAHCDLSVSSTLPRSNYFRIFFSNAPPIEFCTEHPPPIITESDLTITAPTGSFIASYSTYDNTCGGDFTSVRGKLASPLYPNSYPVNVECIWTIGNRKGNNIEIEFNDINIDDSEHCNEDYIEIRESNASGKLLGVFCGQAIPTTIVAFETIWMRFHSDDKSVGKGFLATYSYVYRNEINGSKGIIESPPPGGTVSPYNWRITVLRGSVIYLHIKEYLQGLQAFDGFDETAPEIAIGSTTIEITSTTNVMYLIGDQTELKPFLLQWEAVPKNAKNETRHSSCGDEIIVLSFTNFINLTSPGYPSGYSSSLDCDWFITVSDVNIHAAFALREIDLENSFDCNSDYVKVSSSKDITTWNSKEKLCTNQNDTDLRWIHGEPHLKIEFHSDFSINRTGFSGLLVAFCGNELTASQGEIKGANVISHTGEQKCIWKIRVRPGKQIKFELNNIELNTQGFIVLKNGIDENSPPLGAGKYYFGSGNHSIPSTSSNRAFIELENPFSHAWKWVLSYKELSDECGGEIILTDERNQTVITTPHYPNIPSPYTECVWLIRAPAAKSINVTFIGRFDLLFAPDCAKESLEVRDGATSLSNLIGVYCRNPNQIKSTGNFLRMKFTTNTPDPRNGFKAEIAIAKCGGLFTGYSGEVKSLNYPIPGGYPTNSVCEYRIRVSSRNRVNLTIVDLDLPFSANSSENDHLVIYAGSKTITEEDSDYELAVIYGNSTKFKRIFNTNELLIKFYTYGINLKYKGFKISFRASYGLCGGYFTEESGEIRSPDYPKATPTFRSCSWKIMVPKGRQVKIEALDVVVSPSTLNVPSFRRFPFFGRFYPQAGPTSRVLGTPRVSFYNDLMAKSNIIFINGNHTDAIYSTDNIMLIMFTTFRYSSGMAFKLRFTSDTLSPCTLAHNEEAKTIVSLPPTTPYFYCEYEFAQNSNETLAINVAIENLEPFGSNCFINSAITFMIPPWRILQGFCNSVNEMVVYPFKQVRLQIRRATQTTNLTYSIGYNRHKCGGIIKVLNSGMIVSKPIFTSDYGQADCAWQLLKDRNQQNQNLSIVSNFNEDCENEFLSIYTDIYPSSTIMKRLCKGEDSFSMNFNTDMIVRYHTNQYDLDSNFSIYATSKFTCGGELKPEVGSPTRVDFKKKDYQNNIECVWDVEYPVGYHIEIEFLDQFFIQQSNNCTKDFIEIRDLIGDETIELGRYCGRERPAQIKSVSNKIQFLFRTDDTITGDGFSVQFNSVCGGTYTVTENIQILTSPNYPNEYFPLMKCNYTLVAPRKQWIHLKFVDIDLEYPYSALCSYDNLTVYRPSDSIVNAPIVLCKPRDEIDIRWQERIDLVFQSDRYIESKGFKLEYRIETCGGTITNSTTIRPPIDHENKYPNYMNCYWNITAPVNKTTLINFKYFEMEATTDCIADYVEIYSVDNSRKEDIRKLCGNLTARISTITINKVNIIFYAHSDPYTNGLGFSATIRFAEKCDFTYSLTKHESTHIELSKQFKLLNCHLKFSAPDGFQVQLKFTNSDRCTDCNCGKAEIRDGGQFGELLATYCGNTSSAIITSTMKNLYMQFDSNSNLDQGLTVNASAVDSLCGISELNLNDNETKTIVTPEIDGLYPSNVACYWKITTLTGPIQLHFDKFDLQGASSDNNQCSDYLEIIEHYDSSSLNLFGESDVIKGNDLWEGYAILNKRFKFCGNKIPADYFTQHQDVILRFKSDSEIEHTGFKIIASHAKSCSRNYTNEGGRIVAFQADCEIFIIAPENFTISLYFAWIWTTETDFLKIYDANNNTLIDESLNSPGNKDPIFANTNKVRVLVQSKSYISYDITYIATNTGIGCGGNIYSSQGKFSSPLYPSTIRNPQSCRWNIHTAQNAKISLTFSVFDMGAKINCKMDYVQLIENDPQGKEKVVRQFCGQDSPAPYVSEFNQLSLVYNKTIHFDGTGWIADFQSITNY